MAQIPQLMNGNRLIHDAVSEKQWVSRSPATYVDLFSDFIQDVGESLNLPFVYTESGGSSAQSGNFIDAPDGVFRLLHTSANDTESCLLSLGGTNAISSTKEVVFEARVKITLDTDSVFDAGSNYLVCVGMATAGTPVGHAASTWDSATRNVGFQLGSDSGTLSIFLESDDGVTDTDDKDSGIDFVSGTYVTLKIDMTDTSKVLFYIDGVLANNGNTFDMSALVAGDYLEPYILFARTADGASTERAHAMDIDYVKCTWKRS